MKYRFFSVLMILVMVASLCVIAVAPASAQVANVAATMTNVKAGQVSGYTITFDATGGIALGQSVTITMPGDCSSASLDEEKYKLGATGVAVAPESVSVSGNQITLTAKAANVVGGGATADVIIMQSAGVKNPKLSQELKDVLDSCPDTAPDSLYKVKVRTEADPTDVSANVEVDDYVAASVTRLTPGQESTVTGGGFTPGFTVTLNAAAGGPLQGQATVGSDGQFTMTAIATGKNLTDLRVSDGTGRCASIPAGDFTVLPTLSVEPSSGLAGAEVTITGMNFAAPFPIMPGTITIGGATVLQNPTGNPLTRNIILATPMNGNPQDLDNDGDDDDFRVQAIIPPTLGGGIYQIACPDNNGTPVGTVIPTTTYQVAQRQLSVDPPAGAPGSNVILNGVGWPARIENGTAVMLYGNTGQSERMTALGLIETDDTGAFTVSAQVPGIATEGIHGVIVYFNVNSALPITPYNVAIQQVPPDIVQAQASFAVTDRGLTIVPESGPFGTSITISGGGMLQQGVVPNTADVTVNRDVWTDMGRDANPNGGQNGPGEVNLNSSGDIIPDSADAESTGACGGQFKVGQNVIVATEQVTGDMTASGVFTVTRPTIQLDLTRGPRGTQVVITGEGWLPGQTNFVTLEMDDNLDGVYDVINIATPDANGGIYQTTTIPPEINVLGQDMQVAFRGRDGNCNQSLPVMFTVTKPSIEVDPVSGPAASEVLIIGEGFAPLAMVNGVTIDGAPMVRLDNLPITDSTGAFEVMGYVPGLSPGGKAITATVGAAQVTASFTITPGEGGDILVVDALNTIDGLYTRMWTFDGATQQFLVYDTDPNAPSDYTTMTTGQGYWLQVIQDCVLNFGSHTYNLFKGWNLFGWLG